METVPIKYPTYIENFIERVGELAGDAVTPKREGSYSTVTRELWRGDLIHVKLVDGVLTISPNRDVATFEELTDAEYLEIRKAANKVYELFGRSVENLPSKGASYVILVPDSETFDEAEKIERIGELFLHRPTPLTEKQVERISACANGVFSRPVEVCEHEIPAAIPITGRKAAAAYIIRRLNELGPPESETALEQIKARFSYLEGRALPIALLPEEEQWERAEVPAFKRPVVRESHYLTTAGKMQVWANRGPYSTGHHFMTVSEREVVNATLLSDEELLDERRILLAARRMMGKDTQAWKQRGLFGGQTVFWDHTHIVRTTKDTLRELLLYNLAELAKSDCAVLTPGEMQAYRPQWEQALEKIPQPETAPVYK